MRAEQKSDRWIAEKCGVHHVFVGNVRRELVTVTSSAQRVKDGAAPPKPRTGKDGKARRIG